MKAPTKGYNLAEEAKRLRKEAMGTPPGIDESAYFVGLGTRRRHRRWSSGPVRAACQTRTIDDFAFRHGKDPRVRLWHAMI